MLFRKQVLLTVLTAVWVIAADGRFVREKREVIQDMAKVMIESGMNMMQVLQDEVTGGAYDDSGYGMAQDDDDDDDERRKRQTETEQLDPEMQEVQSIWRDMWETLMHGAKKIVKKIAQKFDRDGEQQQAETEYYN